MFERVYSYPTSDSHPLIFSSWIYVVLCTLVILLCFVRLNGSRVTMQVERDRNDVGARSPIVFLIFSVFVECIRTIIYIYSYISVREAWTPISVVETHYHSIVRFRRFRIFFFLHTFEFCFWIKVSRMIHSRVRDVAQACDLTSCKL